MACKDIIVKLADHRSAEGSVLRNVDLTVVMYDIVNFLPLFPYVRHLGWYIRQCSGYF